MSSYIIEGGKKLEGEVKISGSKNASLPIISACILNGTTSTIHNVPDIGDIKSTLEILKQLGCRVKRMNNKVQINSANIKTCEIPDYLMRELRSSVIIVGALLARFKKATFTYPGGCDIGTRPIDLHLNGFRKMGAIVNDDSGTIKCYAEKLLGTEINLDLPSVGATENIMLTAVLAEGTTTIRNAALEPEIVDLQNMLNKMGAQVEGAGTDVINITGVKKLKAVNYNVMPDRIEAGTFLSATAITGGKVKLTNVMPEHLKPVIYKLEEMGCKIEVQEKSIEMESPKRLKAVDIKTMPYPGFPTDMQPLISTALTVAKGTSIVVENIFESRFKYIEELKRMGAKATIEGRTAIIKGTKKLKGTHVKSSDLRGGAALVIAGLAAKGRTEVNNIEYLLRGYEKFDKKLNQLGAKVTKI